MLKKSTFFVQSLRIVKVQMKLYKPEENCKILLSKIVAGGMIILGTLCRKMIILAEEALCSRAEKFRSAVPAGCTRPSTYHTDSNHNHSTCNSHWRHSEIKEIQMTISEKYRLQDLHADSNRNESTSAKIQYTICLIFIRHLLNYVKQNLNMVKENINNFTLMKWEICKSESFYADYLGKNLKKHSR